MIREEVLKQERVWRALRRHGEMSATQIALVMNPKRVSDRQSICAVRGTLRSLIEAGCVTASGTTNSRTYAATDIAPRDRRGKMPGSAAGRAIAHESTRQHLYQYCGKVDTSYVDWAENIA